MNCSLHQQKDAAGACVFCGNLFCEDCLIKIDGKYYCKEHAAQMLNEPGRTGGREVYEEPREVRQDRSAPYVVVNNAYPYPYQPKSKVIAFLLCVFFGLAGFHRFYVGKIGTGLLYLFTGGLCGIGYLVDIIMIVFGGFRDANGFFLH